MLRDRFFAYDWQLDSDQENVTSIRAYGLDTNNRNVCVRIDNFTPYVYIELPTHIKWTNDKAQLLGNKLDSLMKDRKPLKKVLVFKHKLYYAYFNEDGGRKLFPYLFCSFSTWLDIKKSLLYLVRKKILVNGIGSLKLRIHESDASPILQLTCTRNIPIAGWINFIGKPVEGDLKITSCDKEYIVKYKTMGPGDGMDVPRPKIMGFDIEVNSSNPSAFPDAFKPGDKVFQISCVFSRFGDPEEKWDKYLLSLGNPDPDTTGDDVNIFAYENESDLLEGYTEIIQEHQPNIIVGYNILGFDIPYMIARAKHNFVISEFDMQGFNKGHAKPVTIKWSSSAYKNQEFEFLNAEGRLYVDLLPLVKRDFKLSNYKLTTIAKELELGEKDPLSVKGIFKCYRIGVSDSPKAGKAMGICGKYCIQDTVLVVKIMGKLQTWLGLTEMAKVCRVAPFTLYTAGQQIKVYSQVYHFAMTNNFVVEKDGYVPKDDEHYRGATVFDLVPGVYDNVIPFDFASLYPTSMIAHNLDYSTLVVDDSVPSYKTQTYEWDDHLGCQHDPDVIEKVRLTKHIQGVRDEMKLLRAKRDKVARELGRVAKKEVQDQINELNKSLKPYIEKRGEYAKKKPKHIMCAHRKYTFLKSEYGKGVLPTILQDLLDARKHTRRQMKVLKKLCKNATISEDEIALVSNIVKIPEIISDDFKATVDLLHSVLDKRQLAYKVSANSMYGATGVSRGYLPFMPVAMTTTAVGRKAIKLVSETIPKSYGGELVYGDTDSNYITFPKFKGTPQEVWANCEYVASEVSKLFPPPMVLEFEQAIYKRFLILTKKRYVYTTCYEDGKVVMDRDKNGQLTGEEKIGKKGVLLARRDNSAFVRKVYSNVIMQVFKCKERDSVLHYIMDELNRLFTGQYDLDDFIITKSVGDHGGLVVEKFVNEKGVSKGKCGDYTVSLADSDPEKRKQQFKLKKCDNIKDFYLRSLPAQVQLAIRMGMRGIPVSPGSRLEYVITTTGGHTGKQYEKIESIDYFRAHRSVLKIDYLYYLKSLCKPLDQVLNTVYDKDDNNQYRFVKDFVLAQYKIRVARGKLLSSIRALGNTFIDLV